MTKETQKTTPERPVSRSNPTLADKMRHYAKEHGGEKSKQLNMRALPKEHRV